MDLMGAAAAVYDQGLSAQGKAQPAFGSLLRGAQSASVVARPKEISQGHHNRDVWQPNENSV